MRRRTPILVATLSLLAAPLPAQQQSEGYKFLDAIKKEDGKTVVDMLGKPGSTIINTKEVTSGDAALHIIVKNGGGENFMKYLLQSGADPNIRDRRNNTPLMLAAQLGKGNYVPILLEYKANPNLANASGETPLIAAVQNRDVATARLLLDKGADPDQSDSVAGMSARAYAARDARNPALAKLLADAPKKVRAAVAGPKL